jgi:serpin B
LEGVVDAFQGGKADLSGMDGPRDLAIAAVVPEATIEVDEHGTVASAATAGVAANSVSPEVVIASPFLFVIRDTATGALLFLGRVADPSQSG